jgi:hypothetical protein
MISVGARLSKIKYSLEEKNGMFCAHAPGLNIFNLTILRPPYFKWISG